MNDIDVSALLKNAEIMINLLEYDSMRSPGKTKLNSQHLHSLYFLKDKYEAALKKKPAPVKKEG